MNKPSTAHPNTIDRLLARTVRAMALAERAEQLADALEALLAMADARGALAATLDAGPARFDRVIAATEAWRVYFADLMRWRRRLTRAQRFEAACRRAYERVRDAEAASDRRVA